MFFSKKYENTWTFCGQLTPSHAAVSIVPANSNTAPWLYKIRYFLLYLCIGNNELDSSRGHHEPAMPEGYV